jgi:hypothetical protein
MAGKLPRSPATATHRDYLTVKVTNFDAVFL